MNNGVRMRVAVVGSYGVGETMRTKRFPGPGETVTEGVLSVGHGGKGSNQAVAARRLGAEVSLLTAVGQDAAAEAAFDLWRREGIDASQVVEVQGANTMTGMIIVDEEAENRIVIAPGALDRLTAADVRSRRKLIESADALIVCLEIPIDAATEAVRVGREAGVLTVFNPAPARSVPDEIFDFIDVMTPNLSEARAILGKNTSAADTDPMYAVSELAVALQTKTGADVVLTNGGDGSIVADSQGARVVAPHPPVELVDTTGAGDSFTGALTVALVEGSDLETAAERAAEVGAFVVGRHEVVPSLPHRSELSDLLWPSSHS